MRAWEPTEADLLETYLEPRPRLADRPWVLANMVAGLDGCAARGGRVGALSGPADRALFRQLRQVADVVLVGAETVRLERYGPVRLTDEEIAVRVERGQRPQPPVAVVSGSLAFDWSIPLFTAAPDGHPRPILITAGSTGPAVIATAEQHADVLVAGDDAVDLAVALQQLHAHGAATVLTEGGPRSLGELAAAGLVDELCLTLAPVMGGDPLPVAVWPLGASPTDFRLASVASAGGHLFLRYLHEEEGR